MLQHISVGSKQKNAMKRKQIYYDCHKLNLEVRAHVIEISLELHFCVSINLTFIYLSGILISIFGDLWLVCLNELAKLTRKPVM